MKALSPSQTPRDRALARASDYAIPDRLFVLAGDLRESVVHCSALLCSVVLNATDATQQVIEIKDSKIPSLPHNAEVVGSSPTLATNRFKNLAASRKATCAS